MAYDLPDDLDSAEHASAAESQAADLDEDELGAVYGTRG